MQIDDISAEELKYLDDFGVGRYLPLDIYGVVDDAASRRCGFRGEGFHAVFFSDFLYKL